MKHYQPAELYRQMQDFFPGEGYTYKRVLDDYNSGEIIIEARKIFLHLQSALLREKTLEFQIDRNPRVFFTRLFDDAKAEGGDDTEQKSSLERGSHLVALPVEPGLGNYILRYSRYIVLRIFSISTAVELVTSFQNILFIQSQPMLQLALPSLGRVIRNTREYRASIPSPLKFSTSAFVARLGKSFSGKVMDVSLHGLSFMVTREEYKQLQVDDELRLTIYLEDQELLQLTAWIRHCTKLRTVCGVSFICGVRLDIENYFIASTIETIVAQVQRVHLAESSAKFPEK